MGRFCKLQCTCIFFLQNYTKCMEYRVVGVHLQWVEPVPYVPSQNSRLVPCHVDPGPGPLVTLRIMVSTKRCGQFDYHLCPCNCVIKQYIHVYIIKSSFKKNGRSQVGLHLIASDGKLQAYTLFYKEIKEKKLMKSRTKDFKVTISMYSVEKWPSYAV